jgi:hypothetical protein
MGLFSTELRRGGRCTRRPIWSQKPQDDRVLKLAIHLVALAKYAFTLESEAFEEAQTPGVPRIDIRLHSVQIENVEREINNRRNGIKSLATSPAIASQSKAKLASAMYRFKAEERTGPDDCRARLIENAPLEQSTVREAYVNLLEELFGALK